MENTHKDLDMNQNQCNRLQNQWNYYQNAFESKLKDQSIRMENMVNIIEHYSKLIQELQLQNQQLKEETRNCYKYKQLYQQAILRNKDLMEDHNMTLKALTDAYQNIEDLDYKLSQNLSINQYANLNRKPGQIYFQSNRKNIAHLENPLNYPYQSNLIKAEQQLYKDYNLLGQIYQSLKHQMVNLQKENISLKTIISDQSRLYKEYKTQKEQKEKYGQQENSKILVSASMKRASQTESQNQNKENKKNKSHNPHDVMKIKQLKKQLKKHIELLQIYKANQQQQLDLIQMLKTQNMASFFGNNSDQDSKNQITKKSN